MYQAYGKYLKRKRVEAGLTQRDVSTHMDYTTPQFVSNWERGLTPIPPATIKVLCVLYGMSLEENMHFLIDILKAELAEA